MIVSAKNEIFDNSELTLCPIEKCELKTADCLFSYIADSVTIGEEEAFDISLVSTNIIAR